ncbi:MAG: hypothetical protein U0M21_00525 [Emergencia sp.]|nr:hypothetical protein [Emergencia sp.]
MKPEELKSLHIDIERGIYELNGRDISNKGTYMNLIFEDGKWSLVTIENNLYSAHYHEDEESLEPSQITKPLKDNLIQLRVVPDGNGYRLFLDDKELHHVENYEFKSGNTPGTIELTVKLLAQYCN